MNSSGGRGMAWIVLAGAGVAIGLIGLGDREAAAYNRYNDGCQNCHGVFTGPMSPAGTMFPGDNKHDMHRSFLQMSTNCLLCHTNGDDGNPWIGTSGGSVNNPGVGCTGCHGRDYGGTVGNSGVGMRAHHASAGVTFCSGCHPNDPTPLPENVLPTYYGTIDTNADDPCNAGPGFLENWSVGDTRGMDNDGDGLYDQDDPDCAGGPTCPPDVNGDGVVDVLDLLEVLSNWGPCPAPCPPDVNVDGVVDVLDLLEVLSNWGPC